jgi:hypothetical protein
MFTDGDNKIRTIKYQTPNFRWWGADGLALKLGCALVRASEYGIEVVLECFMFCEGCVHAEKTLSQHHVL